MAKAHTLDVIGDHPTDRLKELLSGYQNVGAVVRCLRLFGMINAAVNLTTASINFI